MWFHPRADIPLSLTKRAVIPRAADDIGSAREAQRDTSRRFLEAVHEGIEIRQVASEMKTRRVRNGYDEMIEDALINRPPENR